MLASGSSLWSPKTSSHRSSKHHTFRHPQEGISRWSSAPCQGKGHHRSARRVRSLPLHRSRGTLNCLLQRLMSSGRCGLRSSTDPLPWWRRRDRQRRSQSRCDVILPSVQGRCSHRSTVEHDLFSAKSQSSSVWVSYTSCCSSCKRGMTQTLHHRWMRCRRSVSSWAQPWLQWPNRWSLLGRRLHSSFYLPFEANDLFAICIHYTTIKMVCQILGVWPCSHLLAL